MFRLFVRDSARIASLLAALALAACAGGVTTVLSAQQPAGHFTSATRTQALLPPYNPACPCEYVADLFGIGSGHGSVIIYPTSATGDHNPGTNVIVGPLTLLNGPFGITLDSAGDIYVANYGSVTIYAPNSVGNVAPMATISGTKTELKDCSAIALDAGNDIYVANFTPNNVLVYAAGAFGNVAPIRKIGGTRTKLNGPRGIAVDPLGNIYVANNGSASGGGSVTVYAAGSNGNVAPIREIGGANTGINSAYGVAWHQNRIYVSSSGTTYQVGIFPDNANGNVAPTKSISGKHTGLDSYDPSVAVGPPGGPLGDRIYVTAPYRPRPAVFAFRKYDRLAPGKNDFPPLRWVHGPNTGMDAPFSIAVQ